MQRLRRPRPRRSPLPGATLEDTVARAEELRAKLEGLTVRYADDDLPRVTKPA